MNKLIKFIIGLIIFLLVAIAAIFGNGGGTESNVSMGTSTVSKEVLAWKPQVEKYAEQFEVSQYVDLILAIIQQESGGRSIDVMQSSESPYNTKYSKVPNGITDPDYSIYCGVQAFKSAITKAGVKDINDTENINLALQSYNFGDGFIGFAKSKGGYSIEVAQEFSKIQAIKCGWSRYGDVEYVAHVLRYFKSTNSNTDIKGGSGILAKVIEIAQQQQGKPYLWGTEGPNSFDCSGLVYYCYKNSGATIVRTTAQGYYNCSEKTTNPEIGDLVFFGSATNIHHIGLYIGEGKMINAPKKNDVVKIQNYSRSDFVGFGKYNGN